MPSYIQITHNDISVTTVGDLLENPGTARLIVLVKGTELPTVRSFLDYEGGGRSNFERIQSRHVLKKEKARNKAFYDEGAFGDVGLLVGTLLAVPYENLDRDVFFLADDNVVPATSVKAFMAEDLRRLLEDPDYTQVYGIAHDRLPVLKTIHLRIVGVLQQAP